MAAGDFIGVGSAGGFGVKIDLVDLKPFMRACKTISNQRRRLKALESAMSFGTSPLRSAMRAEIKKQNAIRKGHLLKSITTALRFYASGAMVLLVGAKDKKAKDGENPGKYFHLVDLGTKEHAIGAVPRQVNGQWVMVPISSVWQHPGAIPRPIRAPAFGKINSQKIHDRIIKKLEQNIWKEFSRGWL